MKPTLASLAGDLAAGRTTSQQLVEDCLQRIIDPAGEGARTFISADRDAALATAAAMDQLRRNGAAPSPYAGIPISIKDLFDVRGQVTKAGSKVLASADPAADDAPVIARLRRAGFVLIGRTNMVEFAYSGLGLNPHYGTPRNPWERKTGRVPGGSSSGAAISVTDGMAHAAIGTDTGGSCRIPAAFTGLVGFKPTARRVPLDGCVPLSPSLDSIGPIARTVACCRTLDAILAGAAITESEKPSLRHLRFGIPQNVVFGDMDESVAKAFDDAVRRLADGGAVIEKFSFPEFDRVADINAKGGFAAAESYAWHHELIDRAPDQYDPRVLSRIKRGAQQTAEDYINLVARRRQLVIDVTRRIAGFDAIVMPTVAIVPPKIDELTADDAYGRLNLLVLRNCTLVNMFDGCAISLPMGRPGGAPAGLMLAKAPGQDESLFAAAAAAERALSGGQE